MLVLRLKKAALRKSVLLLVFGLLVLVLMTSASDKLEKSKKDDLKIKDVNFAKSIGGVKEDKSIWHLKEGFLLQNVTPETSHNGEYVKVEYENDSIINSLNVSYRFYANQAKIDFFEVFRNVTIQKNGTNDSYSDIKWVSIEPIIQVEDNATVYTTNISFGEQIRTIPAPLIHNIPIKYDVLTCDGNNCNEIDPILYSNNIATGIVACSDNNTQTTHGCAKVKDGAWATWNDCWAGNDNQISGNMTMQLNRSFNIGTINITQGQGGYRAGYTIVWFSDDNVTFTNPLNMSFPTGSSSQYSGDGYNFTNLTGYGNATYIKFEVINSSMNEGANNPIGFCEVLLYEYQAPAQVSVVLPSVNVSILNRTSSNASVILASEHVWSNANYSHASNLPEENSTFKWYTNNTNQSWGGGNRTVEMVAMIYKGAVGYWHLDENGGTNGYADSSGFGNTALAAGNVVTNISGIIGGAINLTKANSVGFLTIPYTPSLNISQNITVSGWFKTSISDGSDDGLVSRWANTVNQSFIMWTYAHNIYFDGSTGSVVWTNGMASLNNSGWHNIVGTINGTTGKIYFDGEEKASGTTSITNFGNYPIEIGTYGARSNSVFPGAIDEVAIYNRSLSASEIKQLYLRSWYDVSPQLFLLSGESLSRLNASNQSDFNTTDMERPTTISGATLQPGRFVDNLTVDVNTSGYWRFDVDGNPVAGSTPDLSGNGNNGSVQGATFVNDSVGGLALKFDGVNDYVNVSMSLSIAGITFSAWVKSIDASGSITVIMRGEGAHLCYLSRYDSGKFFCIFDGSSAGNSAAQDSITSINNGDWHFVTGTNDGSTTRLYVDGVQENSYAETLTTSINMFGVGSSVAPSQFFNGTIDEVRILNRSLSAAEVLADYRKAAKGLGLINNSYINYSAAGNFNEKEGTVEFWVKPEWNGNDNLAHALFDTETAADFNITKTATNDLAVYLGNPGRVLPRYNITNWTSGNWKHVAVTWNNYTSNFTLHVNGIQVNNTGTAFTIPVPKSYLIGSMAPGTSDFANVTISEFRISRKALTAQEINLTYSKGRAFFQNEYLLNSSNFKKGDGFKLEYTPKDNASNNGTMQNSSVLMVQNTPPTGNISFPKNSIFTNLNHLNFTNSSDIDGDTITAVWSINGTFNISSVSNTTFSATSERNYAINLSLFDGSDYTPNQSITFNYDNTTPTINYAVPSIANASFINVSWVFLNFSYTETFNSTFLIRNGSTNWTNVNASGGYFFYNFTSLSDGNYTFYGWINDSAGNSVQTVNRTIYVDTISPSISLIANTPANNSFLNTNSIFINTSENDAGNDHNELSAFIDFNNSLVGYWRFEDDGDTNTTDFSSFNNNGSMFGFGCTSVNCNLTGGLAGVASGFTSAGKRGRALAFDGDGDYVLVQNMGFNWSASNFTAVLWADSLSSKNVQGLVSDRGDAGNGRWWTLGTMDNGRIQVELGNGSTQTYLLSSIYPAGKGWQHYALTKTGLTWTLYYNGVLNKTITTAATFTDIGASTNDFIIGKWSSTTQIWNGSIDDVQIWSRALSADEINASFQAGTYQLSRTFTNLADGNYSYQAYVVDAAGNMNNTIMQNFTVDTTPPSLSNGSNLLNLSPYYQRTTTAALNFSWAELNNASVFIRNGTGGMVSNTTPTLNSSYMQYTFTGLNDANYTFSAWMNDTAGNVNETLNVTVVVDTTAPTVIYGLSSDGNATAFNRNYIILNITVSELYTNTSATMNVSLMNGSSNLVTSINVTYNTTGDSGIASNNISFLNLANGTYNITIKLVDKVGNANNTIVNRTIRIDTGLPRINWITPVGANQVIYRNDRNLPINASCDDDLGIFRCNLSIYFGNNGTIFYNNLSDNANVTVDWRNLTLSVPSDATYVIEMNATDDLTFSPQIPNLQSVSQGLTMTYTDVNKKLNYTIKPSIYVGNTLVDLSTINFGRNTNKQGNHFKTDYNLNLTKLPSGLKAVIANARLILTLESTAPLTARNKTSGLILIGGIYYFHVKDIADLGFNVSTNVTNSTRADIIIMQGNSNWLSILNLDPVTGGLNQYGEQTNITTDTILPVPLFSLPTPLNTTYTTLNRINISFNVTDANFKNISVIISNDSGVLNNTWFTVPNSSLNYTLNDAHYTVVLTTYDLANNSNTSILRNFTVDTINPTLTLISTYDTNNTVVGRNYIALNITMNETNRKNLTIRLKNGTDTASTVNISGNSTPLWNLFNFTGLVDQRYNITITATDLADNINNTFQNISVTVDTTAPNVSVQRPFQDEKVGTTFNIQFQVNDTVGISQCNITSGVLGTITNGTVLNVSNGNENNHMNASSLQPSNQVSFSVRCMDYVGNTAVSPVRTFSIAEIAGFVGGDNGIQGDVMQKKQCAAGEKPFSLNQTDYCISCTGTVTTAGGKVYCVEKSEPIQASINPLQSLPNSKGATILMVAAAIAWAVFGTNLIFKKKPKVKGYG